jgi:hypothetical protein
MERLKETTQTSDIIPDVVAEILTKNISNKIQERNRHANLLGIINVVVAVVVDGDDDYDGNSNTATTTTSTHNNDSISLFYFRNTMPLCAAGSAYPKQYKSHLHSPYYDSEEATAYRYIQPYSISRSTVSYPAQLSCRQPFVSYSGGLRFKSWPRDRLS